MDRLAAALADAEKNCAPEHFDRINRALRAKTKEIRRLQKLAYPDEYGREVDPKVKALLEEFEKLLKPHFGDYENQTHIDTALLSLLKGFANQLPAVNARFHKMFRQADCVEAGRGQVDSAIWSLLYCSERFWAAYGTINGRDTDDG